jgi:hypothetical protein
MAAKMIAVSLALWATLGWAGDDPKGKPVQEEVFVLGKDLIQLLDKDPDAVILVGEKARQYLESARDRERPGTPAVLVQQCQIRGELMEDQARIQVEVTVKCDRDGRRPVALGLGEGNLVSASIDGGSPFLTRDGQGWTAWVEGPGQHTISVALQRPLAGSKSLPSLVCTIPEAPITSLELKSLRGVADVKLAPAAPGVQSPPVTVRPVGDSKPQIEAALGPRKKLDLRWRWSDGQSREIAPLFQTASDVVASIEAGVIQIRTELRLQVRRGSISTCELRTSPDERVLDLRATDGSTPGWQSSVENGEQRIIIHFTEPLTASAELMISSEVPWTGDSRTLHGMTVLGAHSHRSVIAIRAAADFDVAVTDAVNARRTDSVPPQVRSPRNEVTYAAYAQPFQLKLSILPRRAGTSVRTTALISREGELASVFARWQFTVHGGRVSQVDFVLPPNFEASQFIFSDAVQTVREAQTDKGRVAHVFLKGSPDEFELRLRATVPLATAANLSKLDVPAPLRSVSELSRLFLVGGPDIALDPTAEFQSSDEPPDAALARELAGSAQPVRGFQMRALLDRVAFRTTKSSPRNRHLTQVRVTLDEMHATVSQVFEYTATGATTREIRFAIPESLRGAVKFDAAPGQSVASSMSDEFAVRLEGETAESLRLQWSYRQPLLAPDRNGGPRTLVVPMLRAIDGPCDSTDVTVIAPVGWIVRVPDDRWHPVIGAAGRANSKSDGARLLVRSLGDAETLPLEIAAGTLASQPGTVVDRAFIETAVGTRGEWHTRARFRVAAVAGSLRLHVPRGGRITRVRWDGNAVLARSIAESGNVELVEPVGGTGPGILDVEADGIAQSAGAMSLQSWEAPALLGDVAWGRVFWQLTLPDGLVVLRGPANYSDENQVTWRESPLSVAPRSSQAELERWLAGSVASDAASPTSGRLLYSRLLAIEPISIQCGNRLMLTLLSSGSVMLIGVVIVASPRRVRVVGLFCVLILIAGFAVAEPVAALACVRASWLGFLFVAVAGGAHGWLMRRSVPRRTVFPEAAQLAKVQGSSARGNAEFALGQNAGDARLGSAEPKTTPPRLAARSSSGR